MKRLEQKNKIVYIPNGIPKDFFKQKNNKAKKDVLFLGGIATIKNIETLIEAAKLLLNLNSSIVGPAEKEYFKK